MFNHRSDVTFLTPNGNHHRVAAKMVSKIDRGRPATSVHGFVRAFSRTRTQPLVIGSGCFIVFVFVDLLI
jgi:hypothetical protein